MAVKERGGSGWPAVPGFPRRARYRTLGAHPGGSGVDCLQLSRLDCQEERGDWPIWRVCKWNPRPGPAGFSDHPPAVSVLEKGKEGSLDSRAKGGRATFALDQQRLDWLAERNKLLVISAQPEGCVGCDKGVSSLGRSPSSRVIFCTAHVCFDNAAG